ncbi:MAG: sigma-54-dependent Fis family transcriptional regulator, partial [Deltaproteobacteria bacterium]|nr:sigma-54-dependent Fis family transcriptional regulator [Deltaproteobacteria bacterium]
LHENLLKSELFGHEKGSFTGAHALKIGLVETAHGGTLFLDEIGEMGKEMQAKLLRFLQEGEFYRVGGKKTLKVNVRVLSATNKDLELEVQEGRFREDLYYRLNTITLRVPPLRKRLEDIDHLVEYFLQADLWGESKVKKITPEAFELLRHYDWPGNIRELQNVVERLKILAEGDIITAEDIGTHIKFSSIAKTTPSDFTAMVGLEELEKAHILKTLDYYQGNKTKAATALGITIKTLYNKLNRYDHLTTH